MINRGFPTIISADLPTTLRWYQDLLGWHTEFESDWFVHLKTPDHSMIELGIMAADHEIVPVGMIVGGPGMMLTFAVDDVDSVHTAAIERGETIIEPPTNLFYGQRRMVLKDPDGTHVDISSECAPSQEFLESLPHRSHH